MTPPMGSDLAKALGGVALKVVATSIGGLHAMAPKSLAASVRTRLDLFNLRAKGVLSDFGMVKAEAKGQAELDPETIQILQQAQDGANKRSRKRRSTLIAEREAVSNAQNKLGSQISAAEVPMRSMKTAELREKAKEEHRRLVEELYRLLDAERIKQLANVASALESLQERVEALKRDGGGVILPTFEELQRMFDSARLAACLEKLPEATRIIFRLRYRENMTTAQMAEFLKISESSVKSRLYRARQVLRFMMVDDQ